MSLWLCRKSEPESRPADFQLVYSRHRGSHLYSAMICGSFYHEFCRTCVEIQVGGEPSLENFEDFQRAPTLLFTASWAGRHCLGVP